MKRAFQQIRKHWVTNLIAAIVSLAVFAGIFCWVFFSRFNEEIIAAIDGATFGTMAVLLFGLLSWVAHLGAFDMVTFGFKQLFSSLFAKKANRDGEFPDYKEAKTEKRINSSYAFVSIIFTGLFCSISIIVLEIIFQILMHS